MKHILLSLITAALMTGCGPHEPPAPPPSKKIIEKLSAVEQRNTVDFFADEKLRQRTTTIYYLIAEDGTVAEVGITTYTRTKVGDNYTTHSWVEKR